MNRNNQDGEAAYLRSRLMPMAIAVFAEIKKRTGLDFPHANLNEAFESFRLIVSSNGIVWLIDNTSDIGMSHMGWLGWMENARAALSETNQEFNQVLLHVDRNGALMPSHLNVPLSDRMKAAGLVEDYVHKFGSTQIAWQRLTDAGWAERAKCAGLEQATMIRGYSPDHEFFKKSGDTRQPLTGELGLFYRTLERSSFPMTAREIALVAYPANRVKRESLKKRAAEVVASGWVREAGKIKCSVTGRKSTSYEVVR